MLKSFTLLYVEDDSSTVRSFINAFGDYFNEVIIARNAEEGLELFEKHSPHILITDLQLPKMSGLEMIAHIRHAHPSFPIIVNSAFSDTHLLLRSIALHVDNYILKPTDPYQLLHVLEKIARIITLEKKLNTTREIMQTMIDGIPDPILYIEPDYTIAMMNQAAKEQADDSVLVNKCFNLAQKNLPACSEDGSSCPMNSVKKIKQPVTMRHLRKDKEGNKRYVEVHMRPILDTEGEITAYVEITHDITQYLTVQDRLVAETEKLSHISMHDPLTHLPNRRLFMDRIEQTIQHKSRTKEIFGVFFIDLDHFKEINDSIGHSSGDLLLIEAAKRMQKVIRKGDTLSRFGGDEFLLIIENGMTVSHFSKIAEKIQKLFQEPFLINEHQVVSSCSIGISLFPQDGKNAELLLSNADKAMYASKNGGRHQFHFFDPKLMV
ncbi:MAG: diguanylate cyclase [Sulfuricurvum sp.]|uniref:diguanylate cyclase domain-containing protein n=1 Tax=Sulfuricurvum sp. TaxID=2025608 RepID=UPI002631D622|nr:diguanylate cyclase [Sulfuricurvum sp.]MDD2829691.1 diguanylate cyclase [Sulfuricurvum sp.]MDD4950133.1 diguanylate cyclase [Sulfuricurvum sp.]